MLGFFTLFLVAVSLSMDTFSLSVIYGTLGMKRRKIVLLSVIVGLFHFFMPWLGNLIGSQILHRLPVSSDILVGTIFLLIAIQMVFQKEEILDLTKLSAFFLFGFTVSIDSFSVGIGISTLTHHYLIAYLLFSVVSFAFTFAGLWFGEKMNLLLGNKATILGAIILTILGISHFFV